MNVRGISYFALHIALLSGVSFSALAQSAPSTVLNEQINLGDTFATMDVVVQSGADGDVTSDALAAGNVISGEAAVASGSVTDSLQVTSGDSQAAATLEGGFIAGAATVSSTSYGNSSLWREYEGDTIGQDTQSGAQITSNATATDTSSDSLAVSAVATANITDLGYNEGDFTTTANQVANAFVAAQAEIDGCCTNETTSATSAAIANSYQSFSSNATAVANVSQFSTGPSITGTTNVDQDETPLLAAASTASANNIVVNNEWGYAQLTGEQSNTSAVSATTTVTLDDWTDSADTSAYGVGNAIILTTIGASTEVFYEQSNTGDISATTSFDGSSNASGAASTAATAVGNAYTGYVCTTCAPGAAGGEISQFNSGTITASGQLNASGAGNVFGSASAIGNTASFTTAPANTGD